LERSTVVAVVVVGSCPGKAMARVLLEARLVGRFGLFLGSRCSGLVVGRLFSVARWLGMILATALFLAAAATTFHGNGSKERMNALLVAFAPFSGRWRIGRLVFLAIASIATAAATLSAHE